MKPGKTKNPTNRSLHLLIALAVIGRLGLLPATGEPASPISNGAVWQDGKPASVANASHPPVDEVVLFAPGEHDWKYSHHQSLGAFHNELYASWSSSERNEDSPGQRVMYVFRDAKGWSRPRILFQPELTPDGRLRILTASGFY